MVAIKKYSRQEGLATPGAPSVSIKSYVGQALEQLGNEVSSIASQRQTQAKAKAEFQTANDYRVMNARLGETYGTMLDESPEDGAGFHDSFMEKVYRPERDAFLAKVPPELREKYSVMLADPGANGEGEGEDTAGWSIKAATAERDKLYGWYGTKINEQNEQLAKAIALDPAGYDKLLKTGMDGIDAAGLPESKKAQARRDWEHMAQVAHLNRMIEINPTKVLTDLHADPRLLPPDTQLAILKQALIRQESGGKAGAISPKGAAGLMQVMPPTAKEIARELGDKNFNQAWSKEQIQRYLSNPTTNEIYGTHYLRKMIRTYGRRGGVEAALIAYNGGGQRAEAWIKSGFDDSVLPKETREYYKSIMSMLPRIKGGDGGEVVTKKAQLVFADSSGSKVNPDLQNRVQAAFGGLGIAKVGINDGFREKVGSGAKKSQHLHGNAMDIDVSGYSHAERIKIIQALSANGVTGLGIGNNIIHADMGGRRAWGYATAAGGGPVPAWAQKAIDAHLQGKSEQPVGQPGGIYASLPYKDRETFIDQAGQALAGQGLAGSQAAAVRKVEVTKAMNTELANIKMTGKGTPGFDETAVSTVLGEDDYLKFVSKRDEARKTFVATSGIETMDINEMSERVKDYDPGDVPTDTYDTDQRVFDAVQKKIDRVTALRAKEPTKAALLYPDVQAAYEAAEGSNDPVAIQKFIELNLERQRDFNLKPGSEEPVTKEWAMAIGQRFLVEIPEIGNVDGKSNKNVVRAMIVRQYDEMQKLYGDYTDEVIIYALSEFQGVGKNTAEAINAFMEQIHSGGDPFKRLRKQADAAQDRDEIEQIAEPSMWDSFTKGVRDWIAGEDSGPLDESDAPEAAANAGYNLEKVNRAKNEIDNLDGDVSEAEADRLIRKFGRENYEAAIKMGTSE